MRAWLVKILTEALKGMTFTYPVPSAPLSPSVTVHREKTVLWPFTDLFMVQQNNYSFFIFIHPFFSVNLHQLIFIKIYCFNNSSLVSSVCVSAVKLATDERCTDNKLEKDVQNEEPEKEQHVVKPEVVESATLTGQYQCRKTGSDRVCHVNRSVSMS